MEEFNRVWQLCATRAFSQSRTAERARNVALAALMCLGRRTITSILCTQGKQFQDWSTTYRLFEKARFNCRNLFAPVVEQVAASCDPSQPLVAAMDDTIVKKSSENVYGAKWRADRKGPKFQTNFIMGQRFLQVSLAVPEGASPCSARLLPVEFLHCPSPPKPKGAKKGSAEMRCYDRECRKVSVTKKARECLENLRNVIDRSGQALRKLIVAVDGGFTNGTVIKKLPRDTTLVGRIRKDAKLFEPPSQQPLRGRKRLYGEPFPTPEEIRTDDTIEWQKVKAYAAEKVRDFHVKTSVVRWKSAGGRDLRLVVIRPLAYRPPGSKKRAYRDPAFLIVTDPDLSLEQVIQSYVWRWEIEVSFRDEKQLVGVGQANVRTPDAVQLVPALLVAAYSILHLACRNTVGSNGWLQQPKWRASSPPGRLTTTTAISLLRAEAWRDPLDLHNFEPFESKPPLNTKGLKIRNSLQSAVLYSSLC